jgi:F-type H+-transporting ATPase subunit a
MEIHLEAPSWFELFHVNVQTVQFLGMPLLYWLPVFMSTLVALTLVSVSWLGTRRLNRVPSRMQAFCESIVEGLSNFFHGVLGDAAPRYVPLLSSLFLYILLMNWWAQIPGMQAATSRLSTTAALALFVFGVTQVEGIRHAGIGGHLYHMTGGDDLKGMSLLVQLPLRVLFFPIHVIGELARPLSLSLRLFGNIMGEDTLIAVFVSISVFILDQIYLPIPLQFPLLFLGLLAGLLQALVFSLLSAIYIGGAVGAFETHEHGEEGDAHGGHAHGHAL